MPQIAAETGRSTPHEAFQYTPNYCEENIYWLAHSFLGKTENLDGVFVVFISNQSQQVSAHNDHFIVEKIILFIVIKSPPKPSI